MQLTTTYLFVAIGLFAIYRPAEQTIIKREENENIQDIFSKSRREASDGFVFPGNDHLQSSSKQTLRRDVESQQLNPAPCPNEALYCEAADDYPKARVQALLKKQSQFVLNNFFIVDDPRDDGSDIERFGERDESMCPSESKIIFPNKAQSREGVIEFIVNEENHKQGIKVEACVKDGDQCKIPGSLSLGYTSHCKQKYILRTLVVVNKNVSDIEGFITKPFEFPSCCACMVSMNADRFGAAPNQQLRPTTPAGRSPPPGKVKG